MSYQVEVEADNPNVWYRMNQASGIVTDSSGNGWDGDATSGAGSATFSQTSPITTDATARSIKFNPGFIFSALDNALLDLGNGPLSIEFWMKNNSLGNEDILLTKGANAYEVSLWSDNKLYLNQGGVGNVVVSTITLDTDWHHVVITKTGATSLIYVDAVDVTGTVTDKTLANNTSALHIGGFDNATYNYDGWLAEIAFYPTVLSQVRVQAHFDAATGTSTQTLLPDADTVTTGWTTAPLYSKLNDSSDATVITATAS